MLNPPSSLKLHCQYQALKGPESPGTNLFLTLQGARFLPAMPPLQGLGQSTNNSTIHRGQQGHREIPKDTF